MQLITSRSLFAHAQSARCVDDEVIWRTARVITRLQVRIVYSQTQRIRFPQSQHKVLTAKDGGCVFVALKVMSQLKMMPKCQGYELEKGTLNFCKTNLCAVAQSRGKQINHTHANQQTRKKKEAAKQRVRPRRRTMKMTH